MIFAWTDWNIAHIAEHGVTPDEAEYVVRTARRPYPIARDDGKHLVVGKTRGGRLLHVIFVLKDLTDVESGSVSPLDLPGPESDRIVIIVTFVIHAMPASEKMKRHDRRRRHP